MKAMILAAGLGTRLRPLTNDRPKALIEIGGRTLLEIVLTRLRKFDIREVIINVHHFPGMIVEFLKSHDNFGMHIEISREEILLDTGGGLKKAAYFFAGDDQPFLLHNVDVISAIDFRRMLDSHLESRALATLAVHDRPTSRYLLFDERLQLCGRRSTKDSHDQIVRETREKKALAFSGIHMISPAIFPKISEDGVFSIIDTYLRLAGEGEKIHAFRADEYYWRDVGRREHLQQIEGDVKRRLLPEF
jgi:NDP-sugar pyrophosphorylase family protein